MSREHSFASVSYPVAESNGRFSGGEFRKATVAKRHKAACDKTMQQQFRNAEQASIAFDQIPSSPTGA